MRFGDGGRTGVPRRRRSAPSFGGAGGGVVFLSDGGQVDAGLGILHLHIAERVDDDERDGEVTEPLVAGGDHEPGRMVRAAALQRFLEV